MALKNTVLSCLLTLCCICIMTAESRPNIIFILADDYGFNDIGYHAREHESAMKTPFLDHLAGEGIKLENYYVQPICSPTRSQLLSGRYQIHTGLQHSVIWPSQPNALPIENILLPEQLRNCGYDTHMVGKWHLGFYKEKFLPWNRGFNSYFGYLSGGEDYYTHQHGYHRMSGVDMWDSKLGPVNNTWGEYSATLFARKAIEAIDKRDPAKPLFLYLAYQSVHSPLQVPEKYIEPFKHIKNKQRRTYAGMVLAMDESIRNVTRHLADVGILDDTIIVFSTDNGGETRAGGDNWPLRGRKATLWEGGIKGVGFVHGRRLKIHHMTYNGLLHVSDWFPTLVEGIASCPKVNGTQPLDGFNQWDAIQQKTSSPRKELLHNIDPLYISHIHRTTNSLKHGFDVKVRAGIRVGQWKLLTGDPGFAGWVKPPESNKYDDSMYEGESISSIKATNVKLFNIKTDPYEYHDVADKFPSIVEKLLTRLAKYNSTAVPVRFPPDDPKADPRFHGGYWSPWMVD
uniref:arylsulfatase I-like n=1 Tax=Styela clava TaxID=7725 RepID=UPI00193A68F4|nr:arylsulfatase I-like [Styela clava]